MAVFEIVRKNEKGREESVGRQILSDGKELKMRFTMSMWIRMEEEICLMDDLYTMMHSKGRFAKGKIPALTEIMTDGEITANDVLREYKQEDPATIRALIDEIQSVIAGAMRMKEKKYDDASVHDETLEEIEKKEARAE